MASLVDAITVIFGPHETNLGDDRAISHRHVAYYQARAAGGSGIIVTETASVHPSDWPYERAPLATECGPGWAATAAACHPHGTLVMAGLGHAGGQGSSAYSQSVMWAPSPVADAINREMPMEMEQDEIGQLGKTFNEMIEKVKERDFIRNTFGKYVSTDSKSSSISLCPGSSTAVLSLPANSSSAISRLLMVLMFNARSFTSFPLSSVRT